MSLQALTTELYKSFDGEDYDKCSKILVPIKIELIKHNLLVPIYNNTKSEEQINDLKITQKILEIGALSSLLLNEYEGFENYFSQLKPFYTNNKIHAKKEHNTNCTKIISLNLIYLLSQGLISKFHIELENLSYYQQFDIENDKYLQFPINLEKSLMEGNYIKIWKLLNNEDNLPCKEFKIFIDTLMNALRFEIAKSLEKSYTSIPINNCKNLLYIPQEESDSNFKQLIDELQMNWTFEKGYVYFNSDDNDEMNVDNSNKIISDVLHYADQIESII
ncbi:26S proteasome regulatory subunit Rpn12p [[Candida] jaroonii]|uniref:26S proteasome regulatory subunit Rpn12p n=1 Tax=[Candida] jaroonii TaxID=467808 RepID=A0ACA9Y1B2_9ASCO|nr:26S proteasome regulatory subunit Rpn12p [[Candida] jaroonii]